jgi:hypothetical protein
MWRQNSIKGGYDSTFDIRVGNNNTCMMNNMDVRIPNARVNDDQNMDESGSR